MPPTVSWDETSPAGSQAISLGDDRIRELKTQVREVVALDHKMLSSGTGTDWGRHLKVTMPLGAAPSSQTGCNILYTNPSGILTVRDAYFNDIELLTAGSKIKLENQEVGAGALAAAAGYAAGQTRYFSVGYSSINDTNGGGVYDLTNKLFSYPGSLSYQGFLLPVHLPEGAALTQVRLYFNIGAGPAGQAMKADLKGIIASGTGGTHATVVSAFGGTGDQYIDCSIPNPIIDYEPASWLELYVQILNNNIATGTRFRFCRITYEVNQPLP